MFRHAQALLSLSGGHDLIPFAGKLVGHWGSSIQAPKEDTHGGDLQVMIQLHLFLCGGVILFAASGDIKIAEQDGLNTSTQGGSCSPMIPFPGSVQGSRQPGSERVLVSCSPGLPAVSVRVGLTEGASGFRQPPEESAWGDTSG